MTNLSTRLKTLLEEKGLSMNAFSKMVGVSQPAISDIVSGKTRSPKNIVEIATALGVDVNWLKTGEGEAVPQGAGIYALMSSNKNAHHRYRIDYLDVHAAAGYSGIENVDFPEIIQSIYFSKDGLLEIVGKSNNDGINLINVPTDSMEPTINKGDVVFIDTKINYYVGEGVYYFLLNGGSYIKRLMKLPNGVYRAISDNNVYPPFDISDELFDTAVIVGKFIKVLPINPKDL